MRPRERTIWRRGPACGLAALAVAALAAADGAGAQSKAPSMPAPGGIVMMTPAQTVVIEHQDRTQRLKRLSSFAYAAPPQFFQYVVAPKDHRVAKLPVDIPVLRVVFDTRVFFDFDRDSIRPEAESIIETVVASLRKEPPDVALFVAGHTDGRGSDAYNDELGLRRARAVTQTLVQRRIPQVNIYRVSFGKKVPIATNETEDGRAQNRRVEFLFAAHASALAHWLTTQKAAVCENRRGFQGPDCRFTVELETPVRPVELQQEKKDVALEPKRATVDVAPPTKTKAGQEKRHEVDVAPTRIIVDLAERRFEVDVVR